MQSTVGITLNQPGCQDFQHFWTLNVLFSLLHGNPIATLPPTNSSGWIKCLWTTGSLNLLNPYSGGVAGGGLPNLPTNRRLLHLRYSKALAYHARDTATEVASLSDPSVRRKGWARIALWHGEEGGVLLEMTCSGGTKIVTTRSWWHRIGQFKVRTSVG